jgi:tetratricopeptide (TPR) repeat protein
MTLVRVLAQAQALSNAPSGSAASGSSGLIGAARPAECGETGSKQARTGNLWESAKEPQLRRYCDLVAMGTAKLVGQGTLAREVLDVADEADKLRPGRAAASVLRGRALLRLGRDEEARSALEQAKARDERALDDPTTLLAWARANARTGRLDVASRAYRAALPRASALPLQERSTASFEAGLAVMAQGPAQLDDAVAMLRQARRDAQDAMQVASVVALSLALDRAGQRDEARAVLAERVRSDVRPLLADARVTSALADAGAAAEGPALAGLALEASGDVAASREAWRKYLDGPGGKGPWAEHARGRDGLSARPATGAARRTR